MSQTKLEKVNNRLYHKPNKDGKPFKWEKKLGFVSVTLSDIRTELFLEIIRPETALRLFEKEANDEKGEGRTTTATQDEDDKYSQKFYRRIVAKGHLDGDRIGLIRKDGTLSDREGQFEDVDITLKAVAESEQEKAYGWLLYDDAKFGKRNTPNVCLELFVPKTEFDEICEELVSCRLSGLELSVHLDTFESEVDRTLRDPGMRKTLYIEEDSLLNKAYLSCLVGSQSIAK